jgi:hypothetical protein
LFLPDPGTVWTGEDIENRYGMVAKNPLFKRFVDLGVKSKRMMRSAARGGKFDVAEALRMTRQIKDLTPKVRKLAKGVKR